MWWFVIAAFIALIGAWATIIVLSQTHKVEVIEVPTDTGVGTTAETTAETPEG